MRRLSWVVLLAVPLLLAGCGGEKDKGRNRDKDRPRSTDKTSWAMPRP
jgi:hypothetical protein